MLDLHCRARTVGLALTSHLVSEADHDAPDQISMALQTAASHANTVAYGATYSTGRSGRRVHARLRVTSIASDFR